MIDNENHKVKICYTNYRGETNFREIIPIKIWFGKTDWHPEEGWLMDVYDINKKAERSLSIKDIKLWDIKHVSD
ncbi:MAG: hypothetical protein Q8N83_03630 [Ignavibacteria bacterium]|nr:hypothetical protein [Ignavibacteria bacterium]